MVLPIGYCLGGGYTRGRGYEFTITGASLISLWGCSSVVCLGVLGGSGVLYRTRSPPRGGSPLGGWLTAVS